MLEYRTTNLTEEFTHSSNGVRGGHVEARALKLAKGKENVCNLSVQGF